VRGAWDEGWRQTLVCVFAGAWREDTRGHLLVASFVFSASNLKFVTSMLQFQAGTMWNAPRLGKSIEKVQVAHAGRAEGTLRVTSA
jgi:hypothetical protein